MCHCLSLFLLAVNVLLFVLCIVAYPFSILTCSLSESAGDTARHGDGVLCQCDDDHWRIVPDCKRQRRRPATGAIQRAAHLLGTDDVSVAPQCRGGADGEVRLVGCSL